MVAREAAVAIIKMAGRRRLLLVAIITTRVYSASVALVVDASNGLTVASLEPALLSLRENLAASHAVLEAAERHAEAGRPISPDEMARETLLSARLVTGLQNVRVGPSDITGAGDGVFALCDFKEGDILTCCTH